MDIQATLNFVTICGWFLTIAGFILAKFSEKSEYLTEGSWKALGYANVKDEVESFAVSQAAKSIKVIILVSLIVMGISLSFGIVYIEQTALDIATYVSPEVNDISQRYVVIANKISICVITVACLGGLLAATSNRKEFKQITPRWTENGLAVAFCVVMLYLLYLMLIMIVGLKDGIRVLNETIAPFFTEQIGDFSIYLNMQVIYVYYVMLPICFSVVLCVGLYELFKSSKRIRKSIVIFRWAEGVYDRFGINTSDVLWFAVTFGGGFSLSIGFTAVSAQIGLASSGHVGVQPTAVLLLSNAIFDGLTVYVTGVLMRWASAAWIRRRALTELLESLPKEPTEFASWELGFVRRSFAGLSGWRGERTQAASDEVAVEVAVGPMEFDKMVRRLQSDRVVDVILPQYFSYLESLPRSNLVIDRWIKKKWDGANGTLALFAANKQLPMTSINESYILDFVDELSMANKSSFDALKQRHIEFLTKLHEENFDAKFTSHRPIIALFLDLFLAALFAVLSIYFGLLGSESSADLVSSAALLIDIGPLAQADGFFGPLFWVMHTSFLPTVLIWIVISVVFLSSRIVAPLYSHFAPEVGLEGLAGLDFARLALSKTGTVIGIVGSVVGVSWWAATNWLWVS